MHASARERLLSQIESSDAVLAEDGDSPDPVASRRVIEALVRKGQALRKLSRFEDAVAVWDDLVVRFSEEPPVAAPLIAFQASLNKARDLNRVGRHREAVEVAAILLKRCEGRDETEATQLMIARALGVKARALVSLERLNDAIACDDELIARFGLADKAELRYWVAWALEHMAWVLIREGRVDEAVAVSQELVDRLGGEPVESLPIVGEIVHDHIMDLLQVGGRNFSGVVKCLLLAIINTSVEAIRAAAVMMMHRQLFPTSLTGSQRLLDICRSMIPSSLAWPRLRAQQALYVSRTLLARIEEADDPDLRPLAALAEITAAFSLLLLGHLRAGFSAVDRLEEKGGPDAIQAFQHLTEHIQHSESVVDQLGTISLLSLRAEMLGDGDPHITKIAYDDSIAAHQDISPYTRITRWVAKQLRPTGSANRTTAPADTHPRGHERPT